MNYISKLVTESPAAYLLTAASITTAGQYFANWNNTDNEKATVVHFITLTSSILLIVLGLIEEIAKNIFKKYNDRFLCGGVAVITITGFVGTLNPELLLKYTNILAIAKPVTDFMKIFFLKLQDLQQVDLHHNFST